MVIRRSINAHKGTRSVRPPRRSGALPALVRRPGVPYEAFVWYGGKRAIASDVSFHTRTDHIEVWFFCFMTSRPIGLATVAQCVQRAVYKKTASGGEFI